VTAEQPHAAPGSAQKTPATVGNWLAHCASVVHSLQGMLLGRTVVPQPSPPSRRPTQKQPPSQTTALPQIPPAAGQVEPLGGWQAPPTQANPVAHWASPAQLVAHAVGLAQAKLPGHGPGVPGVQVPLPSQLPCGVKVVPAQDAAPQAVPAGAGGLEHPVVGSQLPWTWQASLGGGQATAVPTQTPPWHASLAVQALPSSQGVPSGAGS
jgi:hypothetical protein